MSLYLETRWQDDTGRWNGPNRIDLVDGTFTNDVGMTLELGAAIRLAREHAHTRAERRPYALRIDFTR